MYATKYSMPRALESFENMKTVTIFSVGIVLSATIFVLFRSAFTVAPNAEITSDCHVASSAESEAISTMVMFVMGWLICYVMKNRNCLAQKTSSGMHSCSAVVHSSFSKAAAWVDLVGRRRRAVSTLICYEVKRNACIIFVSILCLSCIIGLFASAFSLAPEQDADTSDEIPNESSQAMKAFTAGWIFVLSLKLRRELIGHLGSSCLLQPF